MDRTKSKVIKPKSPNSSLTRNQENESRSTTLISNRIMKKRGVYVERIPDSSPDGNISTQKEPVKAPRRPNRGQKLFLASVLNLLSKSSTGTQTPDTNNMKSKHPLENATTPNHNPNAREDKIKTVRTEKKKRKYISRVVENYREYDQEDNFEVIQPRKDIIQTPSLVYSDTGKLEESFENIKWAEFLPRLVQPDQSELNLEKERRLSHLVKEVAEGRMEKDQKEEDPTTLVASQRNGSGLYNFFVDLLETTFSVYPNHEKYNNIPSGMSSKVALEIDESVANRLVVGSESVHERNSSPPRNINRIKKDDDKFLDYFKEHSFSQPVIKPKRMKPQFLNNFTHKTPAPYSRSADDTQRLTKKQTKKNALLDMMKAQLSMDNCPFEEPPNFYNALKLIAKNKRKQKTIRFDDSFRSDHEKGTVRKRKETVKSKNHSEYKLSNQLKRFSKPATPHTPTVYASKYSLEVLNVENDPVKSKKSSRKKPKELTLTYHSSQSEIEEDMEGDSVSYHPMAPMMQQIIMTVGTVCGEPKSVEEFICLDDL